MNSGNRKHFILVYPELLMPRSHSGEGATMISANIEEQRRLQIRQNSPKKVGKCSHVIKDLHTSTTPLRCSSK